VRSKNFTSPFYTFFFKNCQNHFYLFFNFFYPLYEFIINFF
jgi:hypothetical protein